MNFLHATFIPTMYFKMYLHFAVFIRTATGLHSLIIFHGEILVRHALNKGNVFLCKVRRIFPVKDTNINLYVISFGIISILTA